MRLVVKTGSAILSDRDGRLNRAAVTRIAKQAALLHREGHEIILVSSGAIAAGVSRLKWNERPTDLCLKQAAAAVGQLALLEAYEQAFSQDEIIPAQVLLTRDDLTNRQRYLNIRNTLLRLLSLKTIPIINENDTVSTEEIQFGDNDTLAAVVATKVEADILIILSDVPGVYEQEEDGRLTDRILREISRVTPDMEKKVNQTKGSKMSVGGMAAKLRAAKMATAAGIETWITSGHKDDILSQVIKKEPGCGTRFPPHGKKLESRKSWIAFGRVPKGYLVIDEGALKALIHDRKSLLPSGIKTVRGTFSMGETVGIKSREGLEVARGLVNFSSADIKTIQGRHTSDVAQLLGRPSAAEVVHRDNLVVFE